MLKFIVNRILQAIPIVLATTFLAYGIIRAAPGDPIQSLVGDPKKIPQSYIEAVKKKLGLDKPWYVAYVYWLRNIVHNPAPPPFVDLILTEEGAMEPLGRSSLNFRIDPDTKVYIGDKALTMREAAYAVLEPKETQTQTGGMKKTIKVSRTISPIRELIREDRNTPFHAVFVWEKTPRLTGLFDQASSNDNVVSALFPRSEIVVDAVDPQAGILTYHLKYGDGTQETVQLDNTNVQLRLNKESAEFSDFQPGAEVSLVTREQEISKLLALSDVAGAKNIDNLSQYEFQGEPLDPATPGLFNAPVRVKSIIAQASKRFDLGESFTKKEPVTELFMEALKNTFFLVLMTLVLEFMIAIPLGIIVAFKKNTWVDYVLTFMTFIFISLPSFWFALMLQILFAFEWGLLPSGGMNEMNMVFSWTDWASVVDRLKHMIMPLAVLMLPAVAGTMRYTRASVLEVIHQDYVRTAKAKGLPFNKIVSRHVLKNALIPIITLIGLTFPFLISGSFITEHIFSWPGMGQLSLTAVFQRDYPVVMAGILFGSIMIIIGQLLSDVLYAWANPRIRKGFEG